MFLTCARSLAEEAVTHTLPSESKFPMAQFGSAVSVCASRGSAESPPQKNLSPASNVKPKLSLTNPSFISPSNDDLPVCPCCLACKTPLSSSSRRSLPSQRRTTTRKTSPREQIRSHHRPPSQHRCRRNPQTGRILFQRRKPPIGQVSLDTHPIRPKEAGMGAHQEHCFLQTHAEIQAPRNNCRGIAREQGIVGGQ